VYDKTFSTIATVLEIWKICAKFKVNLDLQKITGDQDSGKQQCENGLRIA